MGVFAKIIACTDFSDIGNKAVARAIRMAVDQGAALVLCHVLDPPPTPNPLYAHYSEGDDWSAETQAKVEAEARAALEQLIPQDAKDGGLNVTLTTPRGGHADMIMTTAESEKADLIVIGTHGYTGLKRLLWGSVAERVTRLAECSVMVVR